MKWTKQRLNNLFFFLGIAAIVVMLLTFDVSFVELWDHLCHAGYWLIPIVGVWIFVYALNALAWKATIEGNIGGKMPVSFWQFFTRFVVIFTVYKLYDMICFDYFLLMKFHFFQYYYPEVGSVYPLKKYGYNIKSQLLKLLVIFPAASAITAWVCTLF